MKKLIIYIRRHIWVVLLLIGIVGSISAFLYSRNAADAPVSTYAVVAKVEKGNVSSGIETTGTIVAMSKLNLDVYKQSGRIEAVNVVNGGHVDAGDVILSFDKSSASVGVGSSQVTVAEKQLALQNEQENSTDANTTLRTREKEITNLKTSITQAEQDKIVAYRDFLNADITIEPGVSKTDNKTRPTVSGLYSGTAAGEYRIEVYASGALSGYSYRVTGLETTTHTMYAGIATNIGNRGLQIKFPDTVRAGDVWTITLPNTYSPEYIQNKEDYEKKITDLNESITGYRIDIANKEQEIEDLRQTDGATSRNLNVTKAQAELAAAREELSQNYDVVKEQDIVAPFSGTVEGLENVVVGATPTRDTNDPISLGTLVSDEFLVKFTLGAVDVSNVKVGQKVLTTVTSFPNMSPLEAKVTAVSSLPDDSGVAQYEVQALITIPENANIELREGLLADVEIVQQEVVDVVRIPVAAITYTNGKATVQVVDTLTEEEQTQVDRMGILHSKTGTFPSYPVEVSLGITGSYYAEVKSGLDVGARIIVSQTEKVESTVVNQEFGPGRQAGESGEGQAPGAARPASAPTNN